MIALGIAEQPEDLEFGESIPETGIFSPKVFVNPKGELTLKFTDFKLTEHATYGSNLRVFFEVVDHPEYEGSQVSFTIWPSKTTNKIELTYGGKSSNLAKLALALMDGKKVESGQVLDLRALADAGAMCRAYVMEGKPDAQGRQFPKINWDSIEAYKPKSKTAKR
jgi:hypothetical protein